MGLGGEGPRDFEQGGYKILDIKHYPSEIDMGEDEDLSEEYCYNMTDWPEYDITCSAPNLAGSGSSLSLRRLQCLTSKSMPRLDDAGIFTNLSLHMSV